MTIKIYVDWRNEEILSEDEYNKRVQEFAEDLGCSDHDFAEFLEEHYSHLDLWKANEEDRAEIVELWEDECMEVARNELEYYEVELEV